MLAARQKDGAYVSDECYKMATTDAICSLAKQLASEQTSTGMQTGQKYDDPESANHYAAGRNPGR